MHQLLSMLGTSLKILINVKVVVNLCLHYSHCGSSNCHNDALCQFQIFGPYAKILAVLYVVFSIINLPYSRVKE